MEGMTFNGKLAPLNTPLPFSSCLMSSLRNERFPGFQGTNYDFIEVGYGRYPCKLRLMLDFMLNSELVIVPPPVHGTILTVAFANVLWQPTQTQYCLLSWFCVLCIAYNFQNISKYKYIIFPIWNYIFATKFNDVQIKFPGNLLKKHNKFMSCKFFMSGLKQCDLNQLCCIGKRNNNYYYFFLLNTTSVRGWSTNQWWINRDQKSIRGFPTI